METRAGGGSRRRTESQGGVTDTLHLSPHFQVCFIALIAEMSNIHLGVNAVRTANNRRAAGFIFSLIKTLVFVSMTHLFFRAPTTAQRIRGTF